MKPHMIGLTLLLCLPLATGCSPSVKLYLDSTLPKVSYEELRAGANTTSVGLVVDYVIATGGSRDGPNASLGAKARDIVQRVLTKTELFSDVYRGTALAESVLEITLTNTGERTSGSAAGYVFSLGLAGVAATDFYTMEARFTRADQKVFSRNYRHAIHSTIGNKASPKGLTSVPAKDAFEAVVEQLTLNLLKDLQAAGFFET